ncbi:MAG TPA: CPBP family glutamic-type intramembrane protease [candidate division Zixibacteria bacterium]|nr:CPBP family glutamic-type intramembrane protease [candidate division Zixibacteria bacterium]
MGFEESLRLSIALGLTIFLVLLRFDSERIMRSDYFRYRYPWLGPVSYYGLVIAFAIGIVLILPSGRYQLFLTPGDPERLLPVMLLFSAVAVLNGVAYAFRWYGGIQPLPTPLLPSRLLGAAAAAVADELQFRSIVLGMLLFADVPGGEGGAILIQALLYGLAQRRLWRERQWYFLIGSVLLGYAAGLATVHVGSVVPAMVGHFAVLAALFAFAGGRLRTRPI